MTGDELPDEDHVVRYVKPTLRDGNNVDGSAFILRDTETGLSVNWLEIFEDNGETDPLGEIRRLARLRPAATGRFAKLNVGRIKEYVSGAALEVGISLDLSVLESPLAATCEFEADPSHAEICGLPGGTDDAAAFVGDLFSECILLPLLPARCP